MTMEKRGETKQLSMQQKVVQIRRRIPALVKKNYSEEVNYDFVKIDDVYRYLAPAMNDYQVNLEVVAETATRKDELGNSVFVQYVAQNQMWMYEADLTLRWINAEEPEQSDTVVIHAIGSHEFPDKAKGSAWTYALKYYLLNKFCIDQGGEDPDMRGLKVPEMEMAGRSYPNPDVQQQADEWKAEDRSEVQEDKSDLPEPKSQKSEPADRKSIKRQVGEKKSATGSVKPVKDKEPETVLKEKLAEPEHLDSEAEWQQGPEGKQKEEPESQLSEPIKRSNQDIPPVSPHIKPESGTMVQLPESAKAEPETEGKMTIEEAMQIKCTPGTYSEHTLGSLAQMGEEGINALIWYAEGYRGRREELREGARLLLNAAKAA